MPKTGADCSSATKMAMRDALYEMLYSHDFETITADSICRQAGVSRSTFYFHYEDKYDLLVD